MDYQQTGTFFIQVTPGFERLAWLEFSQKFSQLQLSPLKAIENNSGGLELSLPYSIGLSLPMILKIPNRILLRLDHFKCRDLPKLYQRLKKQDWRLFNANQKFTFHVSSINSRLFDDRKISKTLSEGLRASFEAYPPKKKFMDKILSAPNWHFFCRFDHDMCTLSLDLCGDRLGKRGYKQASGLAPLRENLAAGLWFFMTHDLKWQPQVVLDPFAGSGTLLCEAALFPYPNHFRSFNSNLLAENLEALDHRSDTGHPLQLWAFEHHEQQHHCLTKNLASCALKATTFCQNNVDAFRHLNQDFDLIISNPPYNKRLRANQDFWEQDIRAHLLGILTPEKAQLKVPGFHLSKQLHFQHGGSPVVFSCFTRNHC